MQLIVFALTLLSLAVAFRPAPTYRNLVNRYKHAVTPSYSINYIRNCKTLLAARASQNIHDEDEDDEGEDEEISLEEAFNELSGGKKTCSFDSILKWDIVAELVDEELITVNELKELFIEAGGKSKNNALSCDIEAFEIFLDLLEPYADGDDDFDNEEDVSSNHKVEDDEDFDEEEGELVEDVFARLSNGNKYVLPMDVISWDVIQDLIEEGATTEKEIKDKVIKIGGKNGLDFEQFSAFVDELVESFNEVDVKYDDDEEDDEDVVEVDPDLVFEELSKGRETISLKDLLQWDLIQTMMDEGQLDKKEIMDVISTVGVADINNMTVTDFEAVLDELSFRAESGLEEGEDLDDAADYTSIKK